jgi:signal transduction histidine kinase
VATDEKVRILIVDDRPETLLALEAILEGPQLELVTVESGPEALRRLLVDDFAVILLDVNMPGMDGFETANLIRQRKKCQHVPIIFLTAYSDDVFVERGYSLGAVDYILAPVVPEVLRAKVSVFADLQRKTQQLRRQAESLQQRAEQLHKLTEASLVITAAPSLETIRQALEIWARILVGANRSSAIFDLEGLLQSGTSQLDSSLLRELESVVRSNKPLRAVDLKPEERGQSPFTAKRGQSPGQIVVPLVGRAGQKMGILYVSEKPSGDMTDDDEALMVQLGQIASIAMENAILAHAREANRIKDQFLATLSHELRSPLNAILGWTRILRSDKLPESDVVRALDVIERNVSAQTKLIEDLLDVSRITAGKMQLTIRPLPLASVTQTVIDSVQPVATKNRVRLVSLLDASVEVMGDSERLQQAILNLLDNAIKFTPAGGRIDVTLDCQGDKALLRVADTGQGIHPEFLPDVFECFRQGDSTTTRRHGGLGIGLAVVRHVVKLHGGEVHAESPGIGQGSVFLIELPVTSRAAELQPKPALSYQPIPAQWLRDLDGLRILLVDDDKDARDVVSETLQRCRAQVTAVASAHEAMESMRQMIPDVLISDISMPQEDGYALIRAIRGLRPEEGGSIPAIALTAYASELDRSTLLSAGFQMHLPKPIDPTKLPTLLAGLGRTGEKRSDMVNVTSSAPLSTA